MEIEHGADGMDSSRDFIGIVVPKSREESIPSARQLLTSDPGEDAPRALWPR